MASTDPLLAYKKKRDFALTSEPAGAVARKKSVLSFVIQKHAARSLHYDFRLELDGTLKSWAIPKGPSLDPTQKRLAVQVEDHPLSYAGFEGVIPPKQYGAGTVIIWDRGTWEPVGDPRAGYRAGKLKFQLHGEKLKGGVDAGENAQRCRLAPAALVADQGTRCRGEAGLRLQCRRRIARQCSCGKRFQACWQEKSGGCEGRLAEGASQICAANQSARNTARGRHCNRSRRTRRSKTCRRPVDALPPVGNAG